MGLFECSGYIMGHGLMAQCEGGWGIPGFQEECGAPLAALRNPSTVCPPPFPDHIDRGLKRPQSAWPLGVLR